MKRVVTVKKQIGREFYDSFLKCSSIRDLKSIASVIGLPEIYAHIGVLTEICSKVPRDYIARCNEFMFSFPEKAYENYDGFLLSRDEEWLDIRRFKYAIGLAKVPYDNRIKQKMNEKKTISAKFELNETLGHVACDYYEREIPEIIRLGLVPIGDSTIRTLAMKEQLLKLVDLKIAEIEKDAQKAWVEKCGNIFEEVVIDGLSLGRHLELFEEKMKHIGQASNERGASLEKEVFDVLSRDSKNQTELSVTISGCQLDYVESSNGEIVRIVEVKSSLRGVLDAIPQTRKMQEKLAKLLPEKFQIEIFVNSLNEYHLIPITSIRAMVNMYYYGDRLLEKEAEFVTSVMQHANPEAVFELNLLIVKGRLLTFD